jgi:hypothetical protein
MQNERHWLIGVHRRLKTLFPDFFSGLLDECDGPGEIGRPSSPW